ncbi:MULTISPECIES: capsule assembly Wzi family protein [unclassified Moraxella]|uniref:capsule assembly Wzi family protein n=1 Tax=unclassified Moraxella TaxID=2685852 RepID=UPI003AF853CF
MSVIVKNSKLTKTILMQAIVLSMGLGAIQASNAGQLVQIDQDLRQDLQTLALSGAIDINTSTWPLSSEVIERALSQASPKTEYEHQLLQKIQQQITQTDQSKLQIVTNIEGDKRAVVKGFEQAGNNVTPFGVSMSHAHADNRLDYRIQATYNAEDDEPSKQANFDGSYIGTKVGNHRVAFGSLPMWWGNGVDGSLIRSDVARPVTGVLVQRADPKPIDLPVLKKLGEVNYQITAGQLQGYEAVPNAKLIGTRVTVKPNASLELGASRTMMWGGEGRDNSLKAFAKAFTGLKDNVYSGYDPANHIAGFDVQLNLQPKFNMPASIYAELIGEDEAGGLPSKHAYLAGIKGLVPIKGKPWLWHAEWANTYYDFDKTNIMYGHSIYRDGYYQKGLPLGHPIGGDGEVVTVGLSGDINPQHRLGFSYTKAKVNQSNQTTNVAFPTAKTLDIANADWQYRYNDKLTTKMGIWGQRDDADETDVGGKVTLTYQY